MYMTFWYMWNLPVNVRQEKNSGSIKIWFDPSLHKVFSLSSITYHRHFQKLLFMGISGVVTGCLQPITASITYHRPINQ